MIHQAGTDVQTLPGLSTRSLPPDNVIHTTTEVKSQTLVQIIKSARMIIVAPLVAGAYQIPTLISTGQYLAAIKCASVASITFLILAVSLRIADLVTSWRRVGH
jgi:hypothetical protein